MSTVFRPQIIMAEQFPNIIAFILKHDKYWMSKSNPEKLEVVNLVRQKLYMNPCTLEDSIVKTLEEMEYTLLHLKIRNGSLV